MMIAFAIVFSYTMSADATTESKEQMEEAQREKELLRTVLRVGVPSDKKCLFTAVSSENVLVEGRAFC